MIQINLDIDAGTARLQPPISVLKIGRDIPVKVTLNRAPTTASGLYFAGADPRLLAAGTWSDTGLWDDTASWID